jgi:hypothetical protein
VQSRGKMIQRRSSQVVLPFTFWEPTDPKTISPKGLYKMRTYSLRPGTGMVRIKLCVWLGVVVSLGSHPTPGTASHAVNVSPKNVR